MTHANRPRLIVGTHHKTGSHFFRKLLKDLCSECNIILWISHINPEEPSNWQCYFNNQCNWNGIALQSVAYKGVHSVRNPARLILSAVRYHQITNEKWAQKPEKRFQGKSYQDILRSIDDFEEKLIFEMKHVSGRVIKQMMNVYSQDGFIHVDLDRISSDPDMSDLTRIYQHCELESYISLDNWLRISSRHCLWNLKTVSRIKHITSSKPSEMNDYHDLFGKRSLQFFREAFGDKLYNLTFPLSKF